MKAVTFATYGAPEVLLPNEIDRPEPGAGHVLVKVYATSFNPLDSTIRRGDLFFLTGFRRPKVKTLGIEASGVVTAVGAGASGYAVGDEVFGFVDVLAGQAGTYAEYVVMDESKIAHKPQALSHCDAATLTVGGLTALYALREVAKVQAGQRVLLIGASGGVGVFAVQLAKRMGLHVTGVASAANVALIRRLGADEVLAYESQDWRDLDDRFDVVIDMSARVSFGQARQVLSKIGVFITTTPSPANMLMQFITKLFSRKKARVLQTSDHLSPADLDELAALTERGELEAIVGKTVPLDEVAAVHAAAERGKRYGKTVLTIV